MIRPAGEEEEEEEELTKAEELEESDGERD